MQWIQNIYTIGCRMIAVENSFEKMVLLASRCGPDFQVLSLGAGYDTTFFR
jgi:O-methyltransferase involved in polyketide biosynthesis